MKLEIKFNLKVELAKTFAEINVVKNELKRVTGVTVYTACLKYMLSSLKEERKILLRNILPEL